MNFYSIDIETTGLDCKKHGITEFAAVFTNEANSFPVKTFSRWVNPDDYIWSNFCLRLHAKWIDRVTARIQAGAFAATDLEPKICNNVAELIHDFKTWMFIECGHPTPGCTMKKTAIGGNNLDIPEEKWVKITPAGKNFGSFDKGFLDSEQWPAMFRHRAFDPTALYFDPTKDDALPELAACKARAIEERCEYFAEAAVAHAALADAMDIAKLIWWRYNRGKLVLNKIDW